MGDDKPLGVKVLGIYCAGHLPVPVAMKEDGSKEAVDGDRHVSWFDCPRCGAKVQVGYRVVR